MLPPMPEAFDACRRAGGRIRTVKPTRATYAPVCIKPRGQKSGPNGGRTVLGHVRRLARGYDHEGSAR